MEVMRHTLAFLTLRNVGQEWTLYNESTLIYWLGNVLFENLSGWRIRQTKLW